MPEFVSILLLFHSIPREGRAQFFSPGAKEASDKAHLSPQLKCAARVKGLGTKLYSGDLGHCPFLPGTLRAL